MRKGLGRFRFRLTAYRRGVRYLNLSSRYETLSHSTFKELSVRYPRVKYIRSGCMLWDMTISVKLSHWNYCLPGSHKRSGLDKVLAEIYSIKHLPEELLGDPDQMEHTLLPVINSDNARLHIINCGHDNSLPYVNLCTMASSNLYVILSRLAPPRMLTVDNPFRNVVDLQCFVAYIVRCIDSDLSAKTTEEMKTAGKVQERCGSPAEV
jgi:hypothetical protein